ncbi:spermatogenesis-associated protein 4 [Geranomyces variabilis]|nr:spermatogenesis-associated protein 4 [Geranomyces variabilis]
MSTQTLPREILKWLQSLDLTYPIKNPRRDFANGYTVAEIFSRYYPHDPLLSVAQMYTGDSSELKGRNWDQLHKFFRRRAIRIPREATHAVMTAQPDAAARFVASVYALFTGRRVKVLARGDDDDEGVERVPHFSLPTTGSILRSVDGGPEKARVIVDAHREYIRQLRALQPHVPHTHAGPALPSAADASAAHAAQHAPRHHLQQQQHQRQQHQQELQRRLDNAETERAAAAAAAGKNDFRIGSAGIVGGAGVLHIHVNQNLA